jgi:hypothetical protein
LNGKLKIIIFHPIANQELEAERQDQEITEDPSKNKEESPKKNEQHGDFFLFDLEPRRDKKPDVVQNIRHRDKKSPHKGHLHMSEERFRGTDENQIALVFRREGIFQPEKQEFLEIKTQSKEKGQDNCDLDHPVFQLNQMR